MMEIWQILAVSAFAISLNELFFGKKKHEELRADLQEIKNRLPEIGERLENRQDIEDELSEIRKEISEILEMKDTLKHLGEGVADLNQQVGDLGDTLIEVQKELTDLKIESGFSMSGISNEIERISESNSLLVEGVFAIKKRLNFE